MDAVCQIAWIVARAQRAVSDGVSPELLDNYGPVVHADGREDAITFAWPYRTKVDKVFDHTLPEVWETGTSCHKALEMRSRM